MNIEEIRCNVELDIVDDSGAKATFQTTGFHEEAIKNLIVDYSTNKRKVELLDLHEHLLSRCRSNQQTVSIIFKNTPLLP